MSTHDHEGDDSPPGDVTEQNIRRLLDQAYRPEGPDPAYARRLTDKLCAVAQEAVRTRQVLRTVEAIRSSRRQRFRALAAAASLALVALGLEFLIQPRMVNHAPQEAGMAREALPQRNATEAMRDLAFTPAKPQVMLTQTTAAPDFSRLTPQPLAPLPPVEAAALGTGIQTGPSERRRMSLPDGSILYVNENTSARIEGERQITLRRGEAFVEVAPRQADVEGAAFVVKTSDRTLTALGTKFDVRAGERGTDLVVTQGKVRVSGREAPVQSGQELEARKNELESAPRASHVVDWARDLMVAAESRLVPASRYVGGALVALVPGGQETPLSLRKYHVDIHIEDGFARTTIDQTYFNAESARLEGIFYFPLPADASLSRLAMFVDGRLVEAGMAERDAARGAFETIARQQRDPVLLEWVDGTTFRMRVFPLEPQQEKRIILSYTQRLPSLYGRSQYRFPAGHSLGQAGAWSAHARIKNGAALDWRSPSHALQATREGNDLLLDGAGAAVKTDRDVVVELTEPIPAPNGEGNAGARVSSAECDGSRYLMLRYRPPLSGQAQRQRRDWVFLFESSADRDPLLARAQVEIVRTLLANAEHDDTFAILTAGTRVHAFAGEPKPATPDNIHAAMSFLEQTHLVGALDLGAALTAAQPFLKRGQNSYLVHLGSGIPSLGEQREEVLAHQLPRGSRYVGVAVGNRWGRGFMKLAAERSDGYVTQINPDEPVAWRAFDLFSTLNTPRLLGVQVVDDVEKLHFLTYAGSLAQGEELCAVARIEHAQEPLPASLTVSGTLGGKRFEQVVAVGDVARQADYLPRTWAKLEIDHLLAEDSGQNQGRIVALSKSMYVMTPYTSLLALENEQMAAEYRIDQARKDPWAFYAPLGLPSLPTGAVAARRGMKRVEPSPVASPETTRPSAEQVLGTVLVRIPPQGLMLPSRRDESSGRRVVTAYELYSGAFAVPEPIEWLDQERAPDVPRQQDGEGKGGKDQFKVVPAASEKDDKRPQVPPPPSAPPAPAPGSARPHPMPGPPPVVAPPLPKNVEPGQAPLPPGIKPTAPAPSQPPASMGAARPVETPPAPAGGGGSIPAANGTQQPAGMGIPLPQATSGGPGSPRKAAPETAAPREPVPGRADPGSNEVRLGGDRMMGGLGGGRGGGAGSFNGPQGGFGSGLGGVESPPAGTPGPNDLSLRREMEGEGLMPYLGVPNYSYFFRTVLPADQGMARDGKRPLLKQRTLRANGTAHFGLGRALPTSDDTLFADGVALGKAAQAFREREETRRAVQLSEKTLGAVPAPMNKTETAAGARMEGVNAAGDLGRPTTTKQEKKTSESLDALRPGVVAGSLLYERPTYTRNDHLFSDLLGYAPGMNTSAADIEAVLEEEAAPEYTVVSGSVDPEARRLIDAARGAAWRQVTVPASSGQQPLTLICDGTGRYSYQHTLPAGLVERVVCDGKALLHLYPDFGVGARRTVSRFNRTEFSELVPWLLSPVEDLAHGADIRSVGDRTVTVLPRSSASENASRPGLRLHFAADGRLDERSVLSPQTEKVLVRETFAADGTVSTFDSAGSQTSVRHFTVAGTGAPNLAPDTRAYVILPLPLRTREHVFATHPLQWDGRFTTLDPDFALRLLAADRLDGNDEARQIILQRFWRQGDHRPGLLTLWASTGLALDSLPVPEQGEPTALLHYLRWLRQRSDAGLGHGNKGEGDGFFETLMTFHALAEPWQRAAPGVLEPAEYQRLLKFVGEARSPTLAWALAALVLEDHGRPTALPGGRNGVKHAVLSAASRSHRLVPGLAFLARYEQARLYRETDQGEQARTLFLEAYRHWEPDGVPAPIDSAFRQALRPEDGRFDDWTPLFRATAERLLARDHDLTVFGLARQSTLLDDTRLGDELSAQAVRHLAAHPERLAASMAALEYLWQTHQYQRAEGLLRALLANPQLSAQATLWRLGARLAVERRQKERERECLEYALELEYRHPLEDSDLAAIRRDYKTLLSSYATVAQALATLHEQPPDELVQRVVRAADRWRTLDQDTTAACLAAGRILHALKCDDLAWDYFTTPYAGRAPQPAAALDLARTLVEQGNVNLAERAFHLAEETDPTNAQVLWERLQNLERAGKPTEARVLLLRLADGTWPEQYEELQRQARSQVGGERRTPK
jgi:ferric-dicitrate binding protein FerR (iron transport regulator)